MHGWVWRGDCKGGLLVLGHVRFSTDSLLAANRILPYISPFPSACVAVDQMPARRRVRTPGTADAGVLHLLRDHPSGRICQEILGTEVRLGSRFPVSSSVSNNNNNNNTQIFIFYLFS
jgi:hypothetical protein